MEFPEEIKIPFIRATKNSTFTKVRNELKQSKTTQTIYKGLYNLNNLHLQ